MLKSKLIQRDYDLSAKTYNSRYEKIQLDKYQKALNGIEMTGKILDLGAGTGLLSEFLDIKAYRSSSRTPKGHTNNIRMVIGTDISLNMLIQGNSGAVQAKAENMPFKSKIFDYVLSFSALMNFEDPEAALKEVKRVLGKNGLFICSYLKKYDFEKLLKKHFKIIEKRDCGEDICYYLKPLVL